MLNWWWWWKEKEVKECSNDKTNEIQRKICQRRKIIKSNKPKKSQMKLCVIRKECIVYICVYKVNKCSLILRLFEFKEKQGLNCLYFRYITTV